MYTQAHFAMCVDKDMVILFKVVIHISLASIQYLRTDSQGIRDIHLAILANGMAER